MIPAQFEYRRAESVEDALAALAEPDAVALAGGQSLLPLMKLRLARPRLVVDLGRLGLRGIAAGAEEVRIGALSTWDELARSEELRSSPGLAAIPECAAAIADLQVRNRGTIGGGTAHADPASDMPAVLVALGALFRLRAAAGERAVPAEEFFVGPFATALEPGELVVEVAVPVPPPKSGSAYVSFEHPASGYALAGAAALVGPKGRALAVNGVAGRPLRVEAEEGLDGVDVLDDGYAPAEYRRHIARVVLRKALERAQQRLELESE